MHSHVFDDTLLNKQQIKEIINGKIKKKSILRQAKWKHSMPEFMWCREISFKRKVYNNKCLH